MTGAVMAREDGFLELHCGGLIYTLRPKRLLYERVSDDFQWNYFRLEVEETDAISEDFRTDSYMEEFGELTEGDGNIRLIPISELDEMSREESVKYKARHIARFLKGSMVVFHKNSLYNMLITQYKGEHDKVQADDFREHIMSCSQKLKGKTIADFRKQ